MAANTEILIKRSLATAKPTSLAQGELAYSYTSNTLFIGTSDGAASLAIGAYNDFSGNYKNGANTYGDQTHIPIITVAANGLITNVTTSEISTTLAINADTGGPSEVNLIDQTLNINSGDGVNTSVSGQTITVSADYTQVIGANGYGGGTQTIDGILNISGDLNVSGNISYTDVETLVAQNSLIFLANNNIASDVIDIGFVGQSNNGTNIVYTGLFRHAGDPGKDYYLFDNYTTNPDGSFVINPGSNNFTLSTLHANIVGGIIQSNVFLAAEGYPDGSANAGFSFQGDGGWDTGLFSNGDGDVSLWSNDVKILSGYREQGLQLENGTTIIDTGSQSLAIGYQVNPSNYTESIAIGYRTNNDGGQQWQAIAIGPYAGYGNQGGSSIAIGARAAENNQGSDAIAIGRRAGDNNQGNYSVALGYYAGATSQLSGAVAIGEYAGNYQQNYQAVAVGTYAGYSDQGWSAVAVGKNSGEYNQGAVATAVGPSAGEQNQGQGATALGRMAGYYYQGQNAVALGHYAGQYNQGTNSVAVGNYAGQNNQAENSIILNATGSQLTTANAGFYVAPIRHGESANIIYFDVTTNELTYGSMADLRPDAITNGSYTWAVDGTNGALYSDQGVYIADSSSSVVIGQNVDLTNSNNNRVTIGNGAGNSGQGYGTVAVGEQAGQTNQSYLSVAVGLHAGRENQNNSATAVGHGAGYYGQGSDATAIGNLAGKNYQQAEAVAIGNRAGYGNDWNQGYASIAIGSVAGFQGQAEYTVAIGYDAGNYANAGAIAIGDLAGQNNLQEDAIAIGTYAQRYGNGYGTIAVGSYAGETNQSNYSVAIGYNAGNDNLGYRSIAIGQNASYSGSDDETIAIGRNAGNGHINYGAVAIGHSAGYNASNYSVSLGYGAGWADGSPLGAYQLALGAYAAAGDGHDYSIVLNASGDYFDATASGLFIKPVRYTETQDATDDGLMFYNQNTGEVRYSYLLDGGSF